MQPPRSFDISENESFTQLCTFQIGSKPEYQKVARYSKAGFSRTSKSRIFSVGLTGTLVAHGVHHRTPHCSCRKRLTAYNVPRGRPPANSSFSPFTRITI